MKKILILLFLSASLFASAPVVVPVTSPVENFTFLVDNATMVDAYFNIFNAMASLFQSSDYLQLLKLVFLLGGFGVFFSGVLKSFQGGSGQGAVSDFAKYMILGTTLLILVLHDKSNLVIKTNNLGSFCSTASGQTSMVSSDPVTTGVVVGNIPTTLAWGFSFLNEIGVETTKMARTAFSPLSTTGVVDPSARQGFASYLAGIGAVTSISIDDIAGDSTLATGNAATIGSTLVAITNDCILIPAAQDPVYGQMVISAMKQTGDERQTMQDLIYDQNIIIYKNPTDINGSTTISSGVTFGGIVPENLFVHISGEVKTCGEAWGELTNRLEGLKTSGALECSASLKDVFDPVAISVLTGDAGLATVSNARSIALNSAMANQMFDAKRNLAIGSDASFAAGKSMSEFTTSSLGSGYYMAQMLPYLQMGMRAVLYAFFPFVFVVILLPGGIKVLISYLQSLLWIELWTPTAAILDMFLGLVSTDKFSSMYNSKGFNPTNGMQSFSDAAMLASVGGYLYASVPALTYLILKGSAQMLGNITSGVASGFSKNLDSGVINRDVAALKGNQIVNKELSSRGEKMVSLAEQDKMEAGHMAATNAGSWLTNQAHINDLTSSAQGNTLKNIVSGQGNFKALNSPGAENAMIADIKGKSVALQSKLKSTGVLKEDGTIDQEKLNNFSTAKGVNDGVQDVATKNYVQKLKDFTGSKDYKELVNTAGEQGATKMAQDYAAYNAEVEQNMANHPGLTKEQAIISAGQTQGMRQGLDTLQAKKRMDTIAGEVGTVDKDGKLHYNPSGEKKLMDNYAANGRLVAAQDLGKESHINTVGVGNEVKATANNLDSTTGTNLAIPERSKQRLDSAIDAGVAGAKELKQRLEGKSDGEKSMEIEKFMSEKVGNKGEVFSKVEGDVNAAALTKAGLNATQMGTFKAHMAEAGIEGNRNWGKEAYSQGGAAAASMEKAKAQLGFKGSFNSLSSTDQAAVSSLAKTTLGSKSQVFKAVTDNAEVNNFVEHYKSADAAAHKLADSSSFEKMSNVQKNKVIKAVLRTPEIYGDAKSLQELSGLVKNMQFVGKGAGALLQRLNNVYTKGGASPEMKQELIDKAAQAKTKNGMGLNVNGTEMTPKQQQAYTENFNNRKGIKKGSTGATGSPTSSGGRKPSK